PRPESTRSRYGTSAMSRKFHRKRCNRSPDRYSARPAQAASNDRLTAPMTAVRFDVLGLGNAIVDVITRADDDFLVKHGMRKGSMSLIDEARAAKIYDAMGPATEISGGSAANTIVGVAGFGGRAAFIGRVKNDQLGAAFAHDIRAA